MMLDKKDSRELIPVSKQAAGGVTGAVLGGIVAGPVGAIVGGVAGAMVGEAAADGKQPVKKALAKVKAIARSPRAWKGPKAIRHTVTKRATRSRVARKRRRGKSPSRAK
jgi:outer membrane lipoprotein SlyB